MYELVENADDAGDRRSDLNILVSAVQSRPCPPALLSMESAITAMTFDTKGGYP